jgi:hypothetical protein
MENLLELFGFLFFMFLVLSASVEVVMEVFRGTLENLGVTWAKSKVSLDEALSLASEFAPNDKDLNTKLQAVKFVSEQLKKTADGKKDIIKKIELELKDSNTDEITAQIAAQLNAVASEVKGELLKSERMKTFILRGVAAVIGCALVSQADFYVFQILAESPHAKDYLGSLQGLKDESLNILVGGLASAAGSSYWHDKLDKVRKLKSLVGDTKKLAK